MRSNMSKILLVGLIAVFLAPEVCDAQRRRRRRRNNYYSGGFLSSPLASVAKPFIGLIRERSGVNRNEYNYNWAARRNWHEEETTPMLFADRVRVRVMLKDEHQEIRDELKVRATWVYLHKTKTEHTAWVDLKQDGDEAYFEVPELEEGRVVKVISDFYISTDETPAKERLDNGEFVKRDTGTFKHVDEMHVPYYGVTTSETNEELQRRAQIVSFAFSQWYVDEAYGGRYCHYDCYSFYQSCASGELEGFQFEAVAHANVPQLAKEGKRFHGDYLIMPGHYGMALCYDEDTGNFITIEGNYALNGPYRINIDPYYHGLYTWSSIMTIVAEGDQETSTLN